MNSQRGFFIVIILLVLVLLMVISASFIRSVDVANLVAGSFTTKQVSVQVSDVGISQAEEALSNQTDFETNTANYFATSQPVDSSGLLTTVNWSGVPLTKPLTQPEYTVQYVIERLCSGTLPIQNFLTQCSFNQLAQGSKKVGAPLYANNGAIFYKATVLVKGPHNTVTYVQAVLTK